MEMMGQVSAGSLSQLTVKLASASSPATSAEATTPAGSATSTEAARTKRTSAGLGTVPDWAAIGSSLNGDHGPQRPVTGASVHAREYLLPLGGIQVAPCLAHARTLIVAEIVPPVMNLLSLLGRERIPISLLIVHLTHSQPPPPPAGSRVGRWQGAASPLSPAWP
jgi:hypothetical protein